MADDEKNQGGTVVEGGGDTVAKSAAPVKDTYDRGALEAKVSGQLAALGGLEDGADDTAEEAVEEPVEEAEAPAEEEAAAETDESAVKAEEDSPEEKTEDEPEEVAEDEEQQPEAKAKPPAAKKGPTLPAHLRRTLKAYEWDDADIDAAYAANPGGFLITAQKLHNTRSQETARWAEIGRAQRPKEDAEGGQSQKQELPAHIDAKTGLFKAPDIDAMVEKYGNEELVREIAGPVATVIQQINGILPDLLSGIASIRQSKMEAAARQIDGFFQSDSMKAYTGVYGTDSNKLDEKQLGNRNKVLELADALIAGARSQGRKLSNEEAMLMAHDTVGSEFKAQAIRKDIKKQVKQRASGISLKPTKKGTAGGNTGPAKNRTELEARTKGRLAAIFSN